MWKSILLAPHSWSVMKWPSDSKHNPKLYKVTAKTCSKPFEKPVLFALTTPRRPYLGNSILDFIIEAEYGIFQTNCLVEFIWLNNWTLSGD